MKAFAFGAIWMEGQRMTHGRMPGTRQSMTSRLADGQVVGLVGARLIAALDRVVRGCCGGICRAMHTAGLGREKPFEA